MTFDVATLSETGGRSRNEDAIGSHVEDQKYAIWVLADGLGGHGAGDVASQLAVGTLVSSFQSNPDLSMENIAKLVEKANESILNNQKESVSQNKMRSTIVCLFTDYISMAWCHIGDSRLYHFRKNKLIDQTEDHSVSQLCVLRGEITREQIRFHEDRNRLVRALGQNELVRANIIRKSDMITSADAFLLCSDGFWEYVDETEMQACLASAGNSSVWIKAMESIILRRAPANCDNYSAICIMPKS